MLRELHEAMWSNKRRQQTDFLYIVTNSWIADCRMKWYHDIKCISWSPLFHLLNTKNSWVPDFFYFGRTSCELRGVRGLPLLYNGREDECLGFRELRTASCVTICAGKLYKYHTPLTSCSDFVKRIYLDDDVWFFTMSTHLWSELWCGRQHSLRRWWYNSVRRRYCRFLPVIRNFRAP